MYSLHIKILYFLLLILPSNLMAYEEATYSVVDQNAVYEIRNYSERLAIQVSYTNQDSGFRKLFNYISGSNINSEKISMTIPTIQSNDNGKEVMQFFLPSNFTKINAPKPNDENIKLLIIQEGYYAVIRYSGRLTDQNFFKHKNILKDNLLKTNIEVLSSALRATYNGPFTLPFMRRNEVMFLVDWKVK